MTEKEATKLLALIKLSYPTAYRDMDDAYKRATVAMWHKTFADIPYPIMEMAFDGFRRKSKFPPTVAEMFDELEGLYYTAIGELHQLSMWSDNEDAKRRFRYIVDHTQHLRGSNRESMDICKINNMLPGGDNNGLSTL